jgi:single-stranded DNA-binding protein
VLVFNTEMENDKLIFIPGVLAILKSTTMENNNQNQTEKEEVANLEQFQIGRNPENDQQQEQQSQDETGNSQDTGYTSGETEFADGQDTTLDQELGPDEDEDEQGQAGDDADFDNPDDDPA